MNVRRFHSNDDRRILVEKLLTKNSPIVDPRQPRNPEIEEKKNSHTELTAGGSNDAEIATPTSEPK